MAADIVNLRLARKRKKRSDQEAAAEQNRVSHGRTKSERSLTDALNRLEDRRLDQKRRERRDETDPVSD
jgi:hypothetical protein